MSNNDLISIDISRQAYNKLKLWASVSRTLDSVETMLMSLADRLPDDDAEDVMYTLDEVRELRYSLDDCNRAAKERYHTLND